MPFCSLFLLLLLPLLLHSWVKVPVSIFYVFYFFIGEMHASAGSRMVEEKKKNIGKEANVLDVRKGVRTQKCCLASRVVIRLLGQNTAHSRQSSVICGQKYKSGDYLFEEEEVEGEPEECSLQCSSPSFPGSARNYIRSFSSSFFFLLCNAQERAPSISFSTFSAHCV